MRAILACIDFSPTTSPVIEAAVAAATAFGARIHLFHNVKYEPALYRQNSRPALPPSVVELAAAAKIRMNDLRKSLQAAGVTVLVTVSRSRSTSRAIVAAAKEVHADMIVMGSHGWGPIQSVLLGSASHGVIRQSDRPVLIIPSVSPAVRRARSKGHPRVAVAVGDSDFEV